MPDGEVIKRPKVTVEPTTYDNGGPAYRAVCAHCPDWDSSRSVKTHIEDVARGHRAGHRTGAITPVRDDRTKAAVS